MRKGSSLTARNFLNSSNIIHQMQSGNRKFHLTKSALLHFTDKFLNNIYKRKMSVIVLLDMSKAFDSIQHDLMLYKLCRAGVSEPACAWFESYLSQCEQVVKIQDTLSSLTSNSWSTARILFGSSAVYIICKQPLLSPKTLQISRFCG